MSLHIYLIKSGTRKNEVDFVTSFFQNFKEFKIQTVKKILPDDVQLISFDEKNTYFENLANNLYDSEKSAKIEFDFVFRENPGLLTLNNPFDGNIFGTIEVEIFSNKTENNKVNTFFDAICQNLIKKEELDVFFAIHKPLLSRAYVDLIEEGEENPLDCLYEYDSKGIQFFIKLLKVLEILAEENTELNELYEKVRGNDKNYLSSKLWKDERIRNYAFALAERNNVVALEGSFKLYADNPEELKAFYESMIKQILEPIFDDVPLIDDKIKKVSSKIKN